MAQSLADVPGFTEAWHQAERDLHEALLHPLLSDGFLTVRGIHYHHLTLQMLCDLEYADESILEKDELTSADLQKIAWRMCSLYPQKRRKFFRRYERRRAEHEDAIKTYIHQIMGVRLESIEGKSKSQQQGNKNKVSYYGYMVNTFASQYGWSIDKIMNMPLGLANQMLNAIKEANDPEFKPPPRHRALKRWGMQELRKMKGEVDG